MSLELSIADKRSPLWRALEDHLNQRLAACRAQNDASQPVEKTEHLRGRIAELKGLLVLAAERQTED